MEEKLIKRTIWTATCTCGQWKDIRTENPPRESQCPSCKQWVQYEEQSFTGPDKLDGKQAQ